MQMKGHNSGASKIYESYYVLLVAFSHVGYKAIKQTRITFATYSYCSSEKSKGSCSACTKDKKLGASAVLDISVKIF